MELQKQVHATVEQTRERSGWPAKRTLSALGIARRSYYRWLKEEKWAKQLPEAPVKPVKPVQPYEALAEEKEAVAQYGSTDSGASLGDILGAALKRANKAARDAKDKPE